MSKTQESTVVIDGPVRRVSKDAQPRHNEVMVVAELFQRDSRSQNTPLCIMLTEDQAMDLSHVIGRILAARED